MVGSFGTESYVGLRAHDIVLVHQAQAFQVGIGKVSLQVGVCFCSANACRNVQIACCKAVCAVLSFARQYELAQWSAHVMVVFHIRTHVYISPDRHHIRFFHSTKLSQIHTAQPPTQVPVHQFVGQFAPIGEVAAKHTVRANNVSGGCSAYHSNVATDFVKHVSTETELPDVRFQTQRRLRIEYVSTLSISRNGTCERVQTAFRHKVLQLQVGSSCGNVVGFAACVVAALYCYVATSFV